MTSHHTLPPGTMYALAERVHDIARDKGFDIPHWDENFPVKLMLVVTELDEAVQWVDGIGKDPIGVELADASIRLLSTLHAIWGSDWSAGRVEYRVAPERVGAPFQPLQAMIWPIVRHLCAAVECWRRNGTAPINDRREAMICVELALLEVFRVADQLNIDLIAEIEMKAVKNAGRPRLHNKGRSVG